LLISTLGISIFGLLSAFSWNYWSLTFFRGILGFFIGINNTLRNSYITEITPIRERGRIYLMLDSLWSIGYIYCVGCAYFILEDINSGNW
jgi:putative MFS transporter